MKENPSFEEIAEFHGHICPGLALGCHVSNLALDALISSRAGDEELVAIVENDACGIDAIQYMTGCTIGKGNLILRDFGKNVYTFINRKTEQAVRINMRADFDINHMDPEIAELRKKMMDGSANQAEKQEFRHRMEKAAYAVLTQQPTDIFTVRQVHAEIPKKAQIFRSVICECCKEMVAESRARLQDGKIVCPSCFEEYSRGW
jgi:formylmethanofuran dehydrogenase subunit E